MPRPSPPQAGRSPERAARRARLADAGQPLSPSMRAGRVFPEKSILDSLDGRHANLIGLKRGGVFRVAQKELVGALVVAHCWMELEQGGWNARRPAGDVVG